MPKSQLAGGTAAEIADEGSTSSDAALDPSLDSTPAESTEPESPADPSAASAPSDVTEDDGKDELDEDLDDGPPADQPPESDPDASGESAAESAGEPFTFRADGKQFEIPGAMRYPEGVFIPPEGVAQLHEYLADRKGLTGRIRQLEQQAQTSDPERHPDVLKARATMAQLSKLMDQGPEAMAEWLDNLQQNRPVLEANAKAAALEAQLRRYTERESTETTDAQATELAEQMDSTLSGHLDQILQAPDIAALGLDRNRLQVRLYRMAEQLFGEADRDYRELGIRKGDLTINLELLRAEVNDAATLARQYQGQAVAKDKARQANAPAVNAGKAPPVVAGSKQAGTRNASRPTPKNRDEWEEQYRSGQLD